MKQTRISIFMLYFHGSGAEPVAVSFAQRGYVIDMLLLSIFLFVH